MENEIKVNEFVRTRYGEIAKVIECRDEIVLDKEIKFYGMYRSYICEDELDFIVKHSPNITGVLEKGDLIYTDYGWVWYDYKEVDTIVVYNGKAYIKVDEREINKIYTKEMMESITYKVTKM